MGGADRIDVLVRAVDDGPTTDAHKHDDSEGARGKRQKQNKRSNEQGRSSYQRMSIMADEACTNAADIPKLKEAYDGINVKLDKCGGLTEAWALCSEATRYGLGLMVGNMCGSSLAMAPAFLIAQRCRYVDLDGPLLQRLDDSPPIRYERGLMQPPSRALWG